MLRGEGDAFAALYEKYRTRLRQYALSLLRSPTEAEDVVHDVFIGLAKQVAAGRAPREAAAYLYVSVRHRCVDLLRRRREQPLEDAAVELIAAPPQDAERIEQQHTLNRALLALPAEQAEVVVLRTWHDLEFRAIAELQGTSLSTALSRYQYGLTKLRKELGPHGG
jgi:RNA polymerase sigma-70 factor (ECF subfamily)